MARSGNKILDAGEGGDVTGAVFDENVDWNFECAVGKAYFEKATMKLQLYQNRDSY